MKLTIEVNVNLRADDTIRRLAESLLGLERPSVAAAPEPAPTLLPRVDDEPEHVEPRELSERQAARMLDPEPAPRTPIPERLQRSTLHPVTQEAVAAIDDPAIERRALRAVAERDRSLFAKREREPVPTAALTPDALAKPTRTVKTAAATTGDQIPAGYLTCEEACEAYGVHFTTLYARVKAGTLDKVKVGRNAYFAPPADAA